MVDIVHFAAAHAAVGLHAVAVTLGAADWIARQATAVCRDQGRGPARAGGAGPAQQQIEVYVQKAAHADLQGAFQLRGAGVEVTVDGRPRAKSFRPAAGAAVFITAAPMLLAGLVVGLLVSIFQAATSINEMTMTFIPKMLAVAIALLIFFPWMLQVMIEYTKNLINTLPTVIR